MQYLADGPAASGNSEGAAPRPATVAPPDGDLVANGGTRFVAPLTGAFAIADGFGMARAGGEVHTGLDLLPDGDTTVGAACAGQVVASSRDDRRGNHVVVDCAGGWMAEHAYLGQRKVSVGALVGRGEPIGRVDSALGFVHFELQWQGTPVDPAAYIDLDGHEEVESAPTPTAAGRATPRSSWEAETPTRANTVEQGASTSEPANTPTSAPRSPSPARTSTPTPTPTLIPTATPTPPPTATPTATPTPPPPTPARTPTERPQL